MRQTPRAPTDDKRTKFVEENFAGVETLLNFDQLQGEPRSQLHELDRVLPFAGLSSYFLWELYLRVLTDDHSPEQERDIFAYKG
jgi:hypothetical protein